MRPPDFCLGLRAKIWLGQTTHIGAKRHGKAVLECADVRLRRARRCL